MGGYKVSIQFDKNFLDELRRQENSGVDIQKSVHHLSIHPVQLNDFGESIKDILNRGVARYNKELEGILLGYQNIKLLSNEGYIHNDSCYIHLDLQAEFYVFKPEVGKEMQGIVNSKSEDHVGILVYNTFNVSLPKPISDAEWIGDSVNVGYEVLFKITYFKCTSYMPYIRGEILSVLKEVENIVDLDEVVEKRVNKKIVFDEEEPEISPKKSKKRKANEDNEEKVNKEIVFDEEEPEISPKKSKKRKANEDNDDFGVKMIKVESPEEHSQSIGKEKKSKKKKEKKIKEEAEVSLSDLNLAELFNMSDQIVKKEVTDNSIDMSYTEKSPSTKKVKKRRLTVTESDEIESPIKKRKRSNSIHY